jgi:hypothetical protein
MRETRKISQLGNHQVSAKLHPSVKSQEGCPPRHPTPLYHTQWSSLQVRSGSALLPQPHLADGAAHLGMHLGTGVRGLLGEPPGEGIDGLRTSGSRNGSSWPHLICRSISSILCFDSGEVFCPGRSPCLVAIWNVQTPPRGHASHHGSRDGSPGRQNSRGDRENVWKGACFPPQCECLLDTCCTRSHFVSWDARWTETNLIFCLFPKLTVEPLSKQSFCIRVTTWLLPVK